MVVVVEEGDTGVKYSGVSEHLLITRLCRTHTTQTHTWLRLTHCWLITYHLFMNRPLCEAGYELVGSIIIASIAV